MTFKNYIWDEQFNLNVARGKIRGASVRNIFGYNAATTTTFRALWELAGTTDYVFPTSAVNMTVASSAGASDNGKVVRIIGLDANYLEIAENITLNNAITQVTSLAFFRINDAIVINDNTVGTITVRNNGVTYAQIDPGVGKNQASIYTVPAGCEFYLYRLDAFMNDASAAKPGVFRNRISFPDGRVLRVADTPYLNQMNIKRDFPFRYEEKTDIQLQVRTLSGTTYAGVFGEGIVINEHQQ